MGPESFSGVTTKQRMGSTIGVTAFSALSESFQRISVTWYSHEMIFWSATVSVETLRSRFLRTGSGPARIQARGASSATDTYADIRNDAKRASAEQSEKQIDFEKTDDLVSIQDFRSALLRHVCIHNAGRVHQGCARIHGDGNA